VHFCFLVLSELIEILMDLGDAYGIFIRLLHDFRKAWTCQLCLIFISPKCAL
jgi:hypothetical protein